ncbi:MAG: tetratricopeptide repeat protein [Candidatus Hodarchaeales archaeon]|jgi:tetratricopeptide (TPR) repeat protein
MTIDMYQALKIGANEVVLEKLRFTKDLTLEEEILKAHALDMRFDESSLDAEKLINNVLEKLRIYPDNFLEIKARSVKLTILLKFQNFRIINPELIKWKFLWENFSQDEKESLENYYALYLLVKSFTDHARSSKKNVWDQAIHEIDLAIIIFEKIEDYFNLGFAYYFKIIMEGDRAYTQSMEEIFDRIIILQKKNNYFFSNNKYQILMKSMIFHSKGEIENALAEIEKISYESDQYFPLWVHLAVQFFSGFLYFDAGKINRIIEIYTNILPMSAKIKYQHVLGWINRLLGSSYVHLGEISKGKDFIDEAIIINREIDDPVCLAMTLHEAANLYYYENDVDTAISYLKEINNLFEKDYHWTQNLYLYILLEKGDISLVESFIQKLKAKNSEILEKAPGWEKMSEIERFYIDFFDTLLLKYRKRAKDKIKAQTKLEELLNLPLDKWHGISSYLYATNHYLELLVQEFSDYQEKEVLSEINKLVSKSIVLSKKYKKFNFYVNFSIIEARILLLSQISLKKPIKPALDLLNELEIQPRIKHVPLLKIQIEEEKRNMLEKTSDWKRLSEENASITKIVEDIQLKEYIDSSKRLIESI